MEYYLAIKMNYWVTDTWNNMNESENGYANEMSLGKRKAFMYDSYYIKFQEMKTHL